MPPLPKWQPRKTLIDLYVERDHTKWYWRAAAILSATLIMIGFLIFPSAFPNSRSEGLSSRGSAIIAVVLLAVGYVSVTILSLVCKSWLFRMDVIYVPCLFSSIMGLINVIIRLGHKDEMQSTWDSSSLTAIVLAAISSATYLALTLITFRKIHMVRARDAMHRHHSDSESYHLLPEDEMQRQQLLRLLLQRENSKKVSPDASQSTFRIDLPDSLRRMETRLTAPQSVYESRDNANYNNRSFNFSPLSPFSSSRRGHPSPYEAVAQQDFQPPLPQQQHQPSQSAPPLTQIIERDFSYSSHSSRAPPYSSGDATTTTVSTNGYPTEKADAIVDLHGEIHPLEREREGERERPQYRVVDAPPMPPTPPVLKRSPDRSRLMAPRKKDKRFGSGRKEEAVGRQRSTSRESRRAEIEMERGDPGRIELEGVKTSPRIQRVETDGWGRR
ncbi:MAG: hypothetical protein LQ339_008075 [Xanthoria mediterranea]|nr:MAG: hypothetical protein LQ339_008075 [Xanthoria mediterranea]